MSCQIYTQCFILEPVPVSYVVQSIHLVFYTETSACILCHAKYTPSILYWNQCLYPMSCQVYTQSFILEPVSESYVVPIIHSVFYTGTSACIPCCAKYIPSVLYWNQYLYPVSCQVYTQYFILELVPVSYVVPIIHSVFYTGTSACIPCRAKYTPSVLYWNQCLYPMSCQLYTQCFILEPVLVSYVMPSIHPVFYTGTSACIPCLAKYTPSVLYWNQCLYPMSCQVYTQCFILEPVPVSHVMPIIHPVFYTGTCACILCHAKYTSSVLYWNQCLYPMSCQVYTQCFILKPVPVSHVVQSIHPVFYTGNSACNPCHAKYTPSVLTGTSARIPCRAKYTPFVLSWNQCLYPMSCQVYTQCFILEPVPVSYVMPSIHQVFNTGTSACVLCHAKYTSSFLDWNQYLYPMSCQIYTQCFILEPVLVSYVMPSIQPVFYTGTSVSCQVYS